MIKHPVKTKAYSSYLLPNNSLINLGPLNFETNIFVSDSKFSLKTRLLGAVKTFHYFLKAYHNHAKLLHPILLITKALSRNCGLHQL